MFVQFFRRPSTVQQECTAFFDAANQVVFMYVRLTVTCYELRFSYQVWQVDWVFTKTKVRHCYATRFFGVVIEVCLSIHVSVVTDDFDSGFIRTYSTVRTEAPEFTFSQTRSFNFYAFSTIQGQECNIIIDTQCEEFLAVFSSQVIEYRYDICRDNVFGAQTITTSDNFYVTATVDYSSLYVQEQWFSQSAWFFSTVKNCNAFYCLRKSFQQTICCEWTEQVNVDETNFTAQFV